MLVPPVVILADKPIRRRHNGLGGAVILLQEKDPPAGGIPLKPQQSPRFRRPKPIDALVLIPHQKEVSPPSRQQAENGMLNAGGILGLIHTEMGVFFLKVGQNLPMPPENLRRVHHLIVIVHPAPLPEHPAIGLINLGHRQFPGGQRLHLLPGHLPVLSVGDGGPQPLDGALCGKGPSARPEQFPHQGGEGPLVGDQPYDELKPELKDSLNEYYKVNSLENYDEVYRAVAFFISKYGRIDWLESNNEYWLEQDARLRTDFNIPGMKTADMEHVKYKSKMKPYYAKAGIPTARYYLVTDVTESFAFVEKVGYPVIVKPDNGVGATTTYKLKSEDELRAFHEEDFHGVQFIMEEFVPGEIYSYDAIMNSKGEPIFETGNHTPISIMDSVNNHDDSVFYIEKHIADDVRAAGRAAVKSFGVKSRFVHFEFFSPIMTILEKKERLLVWK